jgi:hypothetical protein
MTYMSTNTKAGKLSHAVRMIKCARDMLQEDFGPAAEDCMELVNEDLDNASRKVSAALGIYYALLAEHEGDDEEETTDQYTLVGRE